MEIKDIIVNEIIAKYMGHTLEMEGDDYVISDELTAQFNPYTESLDSLLPVWEKLGYLSLDLVMCPFEETKHNSASVQLAYSNDEHNSHKDNVTMKEVITDYLSPTQSAAYATAKLIQTFKGN